jgi:predicted phage terminase large subunit-like protein
MTIDFSGWSAEDKAKFWFAAKAIDARDCPNAFIEFVGGYEQGAIHREFQAHISAHTESHTEIPRGHGKTEQSAYRVAWEIGRNPNIRVKYVQQSDRESRKTSATIRDIIESERYHIVFPDIEPDEREWGKEAFSVKRTRIGRDPTVEASGIFGRAGGRWDLLIGDDVCDEKNTLQQPSLREQVKRAWANTWGPMADVTRDSPPRIWTVGTPWHLDDITADWRRYHEKQGSLLRRPSVGYQSPWPEHFTEERAREFEAKYGPIAYARAYKLEPVSDDIAVIKKEWIRFWKGDLPSGNQYRIMAVDPAISKSSKADYSAVVEAVYIVPNLYVTGLYRNRWSFPELLNVIRRRYAEFQPNIIAVESVSFQQAIGEQLLTEFAYPIRPCKGKEIGNKRYHAEWLGTHFHNGKIFLPGDELGGIRSDMEILYSELTAFPAAAHDDTLDALFYAGQMALKSPHSMPRSRSLDEIRRELEKKE